MNEKHRVSAASFIRWPLLSNSVTWERELTPPDADQKTASHCHVPDSVPVQRPNASGKIQQPQNGIQSDCEEVGHKRAKAEGTRVLFCSQLPLKLAAKPGQQFWDA